MQGKAGQKSEQRTQTSIQPEKRHTPSPFFQALNQRRIKGEKKEPKKMQGAIEAGQRSIGSAQKSKSKKKQKNKILRQRTKAASKQKKGRPLHTFFSFLNQRRKKRGKNQRAKRRGQRPTRKKSTPFTLFSALNQRPSTRGPKSGKKKNQNRSQKPDQRFRPQKTQKTRHRSLNQLASSLE